MEKFIFRIVFCDNDELMRVVWEMEAKYYADQLFVFSSPEELLARVNSIPEESVFFLDYEYGNNSMTGVDLAERINFLKPHSRIFLCTGYLPGQINLKGAKVEICGKQPEIIKKLYYEYVILKEK